MQIFYSEIPENKSVFLSLTHIYGLNKSISEIICKKKGFSKNYIFNEVPPQKITKLIKTIELSVLLLGNDLKKKKKLNQQRLVSIKSYKGFRKDQGLPIRGQ